MNRKKMKFIFFQPHTPISIKFIFFNALDWLSPVKRVTLKPIKDCHFDDNHLCFFGKDPNTSLTWSNKSLFKLCGFYMFEIVIKDLSVICHSKLYVDYGEGFSEEDSFPLMLKKGCSKRICCFKYPVRSMRWDPHDGDDGAIKNIQLKLVKLTKGRAAHLVNKKLANAKKPVVTTNNLMGNFKLYSQLFSDAATTIDYAQWIHLNEKELADETKLSAEANSFRYRPLISIILPTYNTDPVLLTECIHSVLAQSYTHFEICIADDHSTNSETTDCLKQLVAEHSQIKIIFRDQNGHISKSSNSALRLASGEFIALLDHDDTLSPNALAEVVKIVNQFPDSNIIYSDEDKIDSQGNRFDPHFKSGWNPDLLYSQNYISHLGVYRKSLIDQIGGFRTGFEGSQDYDLLLRTVAACDGKGIQHIPKVLYHWRAIEGSTALDAGEKSYTTEAGIKALKDFFRSRGESVSVEQGLVANTYKVNWNYYKKKKPLVSLVIPTYNGKAITEQAINSILTKTKYPNYEIILVDNNSDDKEALDYFLEIDQHEKVHVLRYPYPFNFSAINNFAVKKAKGEIIGLVNNDVEVINPEWLEEMVSHAIRPEIGCVGAKLYYPNDTIQHAGVILGLGGVAGHSHKHFPSDHPGYFYRLTIAQNLSAITAACLLVKKSIYKQVKGLNEKDLTIAFNDVDFCLKVQAAGYRNLWTPYAKLYHHESISRGAEDNPEKIARFNKEIEYMKQAWKTDKQVDRYYSCNLTVNREDFSYSEQSRHLNS